MPNSKKIVSMELVEKVAEVPATNFNQLEELSRVIKVTGDNLIQTIGDLNMQILNSQKPRIYFTGLIVNRVKQG